MPNIRFEWHEHIKGIERECNAVRTAVDRFKAQILETPDLVRKGDETRAHLAAADSNLEGTYLVRLFAAFEAALRSYDCASHNDPTRKGKAATLIDQIAGRKGKGISSAIRAGGLQVAKLLGARERRRACSYDAGGGTGNSSEVSR